MQEIGLSRCKQFLYFLGLNGSLQNHASGAKIAAPGGKDLFSQTYAIDCSNTRPPHFGQGPSGVRPEKSTFSAASSPAWRPKSNSARSSGLSRTIAANGFPTRLRNPVRGPTERLAIRVSISSAENSRLDTTFQMKKSHFWHLNLR